MARTDRPFAAFAATILLTAMAASGTFSAGAVQAATTTGVKQPFEFYIERGNYFSKQVHLHVAKAKKALSKNDTKTVCKELGLARDNAYYYSFIAVDAEKFYPTGEQGEVGRAMLSLSDDYRKLTTELLAKSC